jgi:hypothetical protein
MLPALGPGTPRPHQGFVNVHLQKYFRSRLTQITSISAAVPSPEGRLAIVTDAGRDAVDAGGALDELR